MGALADAGKGAFSSIEAGFTVGLPARTGGFNGTTGVLYNWRLNEGYFIAGTTERDREIAGTDEFKPETLKVMQNLYNQFQSDYFEQPVKPLNVGWKEIKIDNYRGADARIELPKGRCLIRVFWVGPKAYQIGVLLFENQLQFEPEVVKVFDTLKIMTVADVEAIIRRKVAEATPPPLPQTPPVAKLKSDAEDENLKGRVKFVLTESRFIKGPKAGTPKQKDREDFYNETGNFIKRIFYDATTGFPSLITAYGYLDGKRVEKDGGIFYGNEIFAMRTPTAVQKPRDLRYSMSLDYRYENDGRLKEKTVYNNDGSVWTKTVYTYRENTVEAITYQDNGKNSTRSIQILDDRGNPAESTYFGFSKTDWQEKLIYTYDEFDKNENWIKRTTIFYRLINGVEKEEWREETFRTITYY